MNVPLVLERDFSKAVVGLCEALFDVSDGRRVFLGGFFALALCLFFFSQLVQLLVVADTGEIENFKGSSKVVFFFLVLVSLFLALYCFK